MSRINTPANEVALIKHLGPDVYAKALAIRNEDEVRKNGDDADIVMDKAKAIVGAMVKPILAEIATGKRDSAAMKADLDALMKQYAAGMNPNLPGLGGGTLAKSIGAVFAESESYKSVFGGGMALTPNMRAAAQVGFIVKAILTGATAVPDKTRIPGVVPVAPDWRQWVCLTVAQGQMTGGVLEYVQDTSPAYDATVAPTAEGAAKPEVTNAFELKSVSPKTIAHWLEASKQILADASALRSYLDARLLYGLLRKLEHQVVNGDGLGTNMNGLYTQAADAGAALVGDDIWDTLRRAQGVVAASGWTVTAHCLNPLDYAAVVLQKGTDGHYVAPPEDLAPIVQSPEVAVGKYLTGDFARGAQLFEREGASVVAGFQNDNFTKNLVTLLGEGRWDLATYATAAFRKGSL